MIYADFESMCQKIIKSIIQKNLIRTNIKNVLLRVMAINYYLLVISLVSLGKDACLGKDAVYNFINNIIE